MEAVLGFAWFCGIICGALWGPAMERKEQQIARLFVCSMVFFYSLGVLVIVSS
jgi:hypothetical protein